MYAYAAENPPKKWFTGAGHINIRNLKTPQDNGSIRYPAALIL